MHENIDRILRRAANLVRERFARGGLSDEQRTQLAVAHRQLAPQTALASPPWVLPKDVDGLETVAAARFAAKALGLRFVSISDLATTRASASDLVVLHYAPGDYTPADLALLKAKAQNAWMVVEVANASPAPKPSTQRRLF